MLELARGAPEASSPGLAQRRQRAGGVPRVSAALEQVHHVRHGLDGGAVREYEADVDDGRAGGARHAQVSLAGTLLPVPQVRRLVRRRPPRRLESCG